MENQQSKILFSWTAPEFIHYEKTQAWFIGLGIITAILCVSSLLMKNYFFALLILLASFLIYIHAQKRPRRIKIELTEESIIIDKHLNIAYKDVSSFWIFDEPENHSLSLLTKKVIHPKITLLLGGQDAKNIREALVGHIKEKQHEESLIDILTKQLKF